MTKSDKSGQGKTQTVHVALPKWLVSKIRAIATVNRRSLNAQVAMMIERDFAKESSNGNS